MDVSQLLIFTQTVDNSFEVHEELLKMVSLHDTTKGTDIFNTVNSVTNVYGGLDKLSGVVTSSRDAGNADRLRRAPPTEQSELPHTALYHTLGD